MKTRRPLILGAFLFSLAGPLIAAVPTWNGNLSKTDNAVTGTWNDGGNPAETRYLLEASTRDDFQAGTVISSQTVLLSATIDELRGNTLYYVRLQALDPDPSAYADPVRTIRTFASIPSPQIPGSVFVPDPTGITVRWLSNENADGTVYRVEAFSDEARTVPAGSGDTTSTSLRIASLSPNTTYWFTVKAQNIEGGAFTAPHIAGAAMTLPGTYSIGSTPAASEIIWYGQNLSAVTFTNDGFSSGNVEYFRYRWMQNDVYAWPADEAQNVVQNEWTENTSSLIIPNDVSSQFYLHIKAYNAVKKSNGAASEKVVGPFQIDPVAPGPNPSVIENVVENATSITWRAAVTVDDFNGVGMNAAPYGWSFNGGPEVFNVNQTSVTNNVSANTSYTMTVRARDAANAPNYTTAGSRTAVTLQNTPASVEILETTNNSIRVRVNGTFPNMELGQSGLQVRVTDNNVEFLSEVEKDNEIILTGLDANTVYNVMARAINQAGRPTNWTGTVQTTTPGGSSSVTADQNPYNPPALGGKYKAPQRIRFTDNGAFERGDIAYYKMVISELASKPGAVAFDQSPRIEAGTWSRLFSVTQAPFAHIQSYNTSDQPVAGGYTRLGPWIIDAGAPLSMGGASVTVDSASAMTFYAGDVEDVGLAGMHSEPYSFDNGNTFQAADTLSVSGLDANTLHISTIVFRDEVDNRSLPLYIQAHTHQNTPTAVEVVSKNGKQVVVRALGSFLNLDDNLSGIQFGLKNEDLSIDWRPQWLKETETTFDFPNYNASYNVVARARNADGVMTAVSPELEIHTQPTMPAVSPIIGTVVGEWKGTPAFEFKTSELPGLNTYDYYEYVWTQSETYAFDLSEAQITWTPTALTEVRSLTATASGKWYLHIRAKSVTHEPSNSVTIGWFGYDNVAPAGAVLNAPVVGTNSIEWSTTEAVDSMVGLHDEPYLWSLDGGTERATTVNNRTYISLDLAPNTVHTISLRTRDRLNKTSLPVTLSARTLAMSPVAFPQASAFEVKKTSAIVSLRDGGNPNGTVFQVEISADANFTPLHQPMISITRSNPPDGVLKAEFGVSGTPLSPNTTYYVRVRALNADSVPTADVHLGTFTTRPATPLVAINPTGPVHPKGTAFTATSQVAYGAGSIEYLRWVWHTSPGAYSWSNLDAKIDAANPEISFTADRAGTFYLHAAAYSGGSTPNNAPETQVLGPYTIVAPDGSQPEIVSVTSTHNSITVSQAPLANINVYGFKLDEGEIIYQANSNYTFTGLAANTKYRVHIYIKDAADQPIGPVSQDVTTKQNAPTGVTVSDISTSTARLIAQGSFANTGILQSAFQFTLQSGIATITSPLLINPVWNMQGGLAANTPYTVTVRALNSLGETTVDSPAASFTTLALTPPGPDGKSIEPDEDYLSTAHKLPKKFQFSNNAGWGINRLEYYRVIVIEGSNLVPPLTDFDDEEKAKSWIPNTKYSTEPVTSSFYYIHFRSYNSANIGGPIYTYGPINVDDLPPVPNPSELEKVEVFISSITWTAVQATDMGGAGLPSSPYHFKYGTTDGSEIWRDREYTMRNLTPNTSYSIKLAVRDDLGNTTTPVDFSTYTRAATPLPLLASLKVHITSATFDWDKQNNSNKTRYEVGAFTSADLESAPALVADAGIDVSTGAITRLNLDTVYWFAVRAINVNGHKTPWAGVGNGRTKNEIVAPIITEPLTVAIDHIIMNWIDLNPVGTTYEVLSNEGVPLLIGGAPLNVNAAVSHQFNGLTPNTTYSVGVRAKSATSIYSSFGSAVGVTLAKAPSAGSVTIHRTSATVSWSANGNPDGTRYEVRASTSAALNGADDIVVHIIGTEGFVLGLVPDTEYFVNVLAVNHAGVKSAAILLGSGYTGVQPPQPPYIFASTTTTSFRLSWQNGTNPSRVQYSIERSMDNFATPANVTVTGDLAIDVSNLAYNTTYFFRGKAIGTHGESPVVPMGHIVTYATHPVSGTLTAKLNSIDITWGANGNPAGTVYFVETAANPVFQDLVRSENVLGTATTVEGLSQNTTYWVRVFAVNHDGVRSDLAANSGFTVTLASQPVIPILEAKWNPTHNNHVRVNISAGDLNPDHTEYAIFSLRDNAYLVGDGSVAAGPTWRNRADWNTTLTFDGMGVHANVLARTQYEYRVVARNHAGVLTEPSLVHPVLTVPAKPNLSATVVDNDYTNLAWDAMGADAFRAYVSETGTEGSFVKYFDFVDSQFIHYIKQEGSLDIPNSLSSTRHNTEGGRPAQMTALQFNQDTGATIDSLQFSWNAVANPTSAPLFFYYLVGVGGFGQEGAPSDVKSAQVQPVIKNYAIAGTRTGSVVDNEYVFLAPNGANVTIPALEPNTHLRVQVKARSSDGVDGDPSPFIDAWTLAQVPGQPVVTTHFDDSHHIYNNVAIDPAGNPPHTHYAIFWVEGNRYLSAGGGAQGTSLTDTRTAWFTKERWDEGFTQTGLPSSQIFTYEVYARNGDRLGGPHQVTAASVRSSVQTITFPPPTELTGTGESLGSIRWRWYDNSTDEDGFEVSFHDGVNFIPKAERDNSVPATATGFIEVVETGIPTPNTAVTRVVRASNNSGFSAASVAATAWTLAIDPNVESTSHQINVLSNEIKFRFKNNLVFGPGTLNHYRVKFTNSPTYTFDGTETLWDNASEIKEFTRDVIEQDTNWYLHVLSYNQGGTPSPLPKVYGPYPLFQDVVPPQIEEIRQDGAEPIYGAREPSPMAGLLNTKSKKGTLSVKSLPPANQIDASFAASVPWAPTVHGLHIRFTKRLDGATVNDSTVLVQAVQDNLSQTISPKKMNYRVDYNDSEREMHILFEQPGLPAGHLFEVMITAGVKDVAGNSLPAEFTYYFRTFLDPNVTNELVTVGADSKLSMRLHMPAGTLPEVGAVGVETDPASFPWGFDNGSRQRANQKQVAIGGLFATPIAERFIGHFNAAHARTEGKLKSGAILSMPYTDDDGDGYVDDLPNVSSQQSNSVKVKVSNLLIYRFDESTQLWVKVPGSHVDPVNKMVVAVTYNMGVFAVIGTASTDVGSTYAFPVPFVASQHTEIKFANLPDAGEIKIYTVSGELVKEIQFAPGRPDPIRWDVKNGSGEAVGADVYIYHITSGGNKKTGKLVIVR